MLVILNRLWKPNICDPVLIEDNDKYDIYNTSTNKVIETKSGGRLKNEIRNEELTASGIIYQNAVKNIDWRTRGYYFYMYKDDPCYGDSLNLKFLEMKTMDYRGNIDYPISIFRLGKYNEWWLRVYDTCLRLGMMSEAMFPIRVESLTSSELRHMSFNTISIPLYTFEHTRGATRMFATRVYAEEIHFRAIEEDERTISFCIVVLSTSGEFRKVSDELGVIFDKQEKQFKVHDLIREAKTTVKSDNVLSIDEVLKSSIFG